MYVSSINKQTELKLKNYTGGIDVCNENDRDVCEICAMFVRDCGEGF